METPHYSPSCCPSSHKGSLCPPQNWGRVPGVPLPHRQHMVVGPHRPHVPHKRWLHRREKTDLASTPPRPGSSLTGSSQPGARAGETGPGGDQAAIWAVIQEHPSAFSLTGRAGGHHAALGAPLVSCRPRGRTPANTPRQSHRAAVPWRTAMAWAGSGTGLVCGTPLPFRAVLWG